ncbi:MAG: OmpA family protein [Phenylobacterium sp.]
MFRRLAAPVVLCLAAAALAGCLTPHAKDTPSPAVLAARAGAGAKAQPCQVGKLADVSPALATFPFDESQLDEDGAKAVSKVAAWLACNPGVQVVVLPSADNHGDAAHRKDLASRRGQAVLAALRADGATGAVIRMMAVGAADPLSEPHVLIRAAGRGW